jgi:hypothetical protein
LLFVYEKIANKIGDPHVKAQVTEYVYCIVEYDHWKVVIKGRYLEVISGSMIKWTDRMDKSQQTFNRIIQPYVLHIDAFNGKLNFLDRF